MQIDFNGMLYAISYALDCVERELVGITEDHAKWVAYISALLGEELGLSVERCMDLTACAALHDNALTQYMAEEKTELDRGVIRFHSHCVIGEENIRDFPFLTDTEGAILYHHENADGSGPLGKTEKETPLFAQIIHFSDYMDAAFHFKNVSEENYDRILQTLEKERGRFFSVELVESFLRVMPRERYLSLMDQPILELLDKELVRTPRELEFAQIQKILQIFAKIIDFKSPFTRNHSMQIARKVWRMGEFYGYDQRTRERLYIAGTLHDIGKMAIANDVLEKPDKLTDREFAYMQNHAWYTWQILSKIDGFEDITSWAALHHEKLNGKGYPFGKNAAQLGEKERLMACIDIYQALSEDRPYKPGMNHETCLTIMRKMAEDGFIDRRITEDIGKVFAS